MFYFIIALVAGFLGKRTYVPNLRALEAHKRNICGLVMGYIQFHPSYTNVVTYFIILWKRFHVMGGFGCKVTNIYNMSRKETNEIVMV